MWYNEDKGGITSEFRLQKDRTLVLSELSWGGAKKHQPQLVTYLVWSQ